MLWLLAPVILVVAFGAGLRLYLGRAAEDRLSPGERIVIGELRPPLPANAFLACPPGYCAVAGAVASPVFDIPWERLAEYWARMIAAEPRVTGIAAEPGGRRLFAIQRSWLLGFPDIVGVEFVALGPGRSSLAVHSRARYGSRDFGVNRKRVERWLAELQRLAGG